MIEFRNVSKVYDQTVALDGLNLTIESGKIIGLIGHNGARERHSSNKRRNYCGRTRIVI